MRKSVLLIFTVLFFAISIQVKAQSCFTIFAGNDTTISCVQPCLDLKARLPDIRSSEDYQVTSIPYTPFPYVTAAPIYVLPCIADQDDKYGDIATLPFNFCFYGNVYNKYVLGTNGVITFDLSNAIPGSNGNNYVVSNPLPFRGTGTPIYACPAPPYPSGSLYPKLSIMGAYSDLFPDLSDPAYKIEARVEGFAPCRRFVMSYSNVKLYNCQALKTTFEVVLHEGTGLIDIFVENYPFCSGNNAIIGIQKDGSPASLFASPPGRNLFSQQISNEGWRFVPSGPTSLLDSVVLYKNGVKVTSGTTTTLGNGQLEATFPGVCQSEDSMSYVVRAYYRQCDNPALETDGSDTLIVYKTLNPLNVTATDALCNGSNGTITINSPTAANIEYSIDGGANWQTSPVFNAPAGTYTVLARVIGSLCGGSTTATIAEPTALTLTSTSTASDCSNKTGTIDLTAGGGTPGYEYSIDNGVTYQLSNQFLNVASGNYNNIKIKDANGCLKTTTQSVALLDTMNLELGADSTICFGTKITLVPQTNALTDTFKWTPAATLNYDTAKTPVASPTDTTKYYLTAKWGVCTRRDSITVNVLHKPIANAGKDTTVCYKTNATLFGSASNLSGIVNFAWSPPDSLTSPNTAVTGVRLDTTRQFTLTVTDNYGCNFSVTDSVTVFMQPELVAFAGNDTNAILGRPHQLLATGRNAVDFVWSPAGPLNNPFIANPLAIIYSNTYFHVHITDAIGCTDDDTILVKAYQGPTYYLPNAFTPNGDGLNDVFFPTPVGIRTTEYFRVFDRYGAVIYQTREWMKGWDGTLKGKPAASGTYVWMIKGIDVNGSVVEMKGTVILLR
jgi:gliding motility-associated-like protein